MMDNLRKWIADMNPLDPHYLGRRFNGHFGDNIIPFYSGGPGTVLSKGALQKLGYSVTNNASVFNDWDTFADGRSIRARSRKRCAPPHGATAGGNAAARLSPRTQLYASHRAVAPALLSDADMELGISMSRIGVPAHDTSAPDGQRFLGLGIDAGWLAACLSRPVADRFVLTGGGKSVLAVARVLEDHQRVALMLETPW